MKRSRRRRSVFSGFFFFEFLELHLLLVSRVSMLGLVHVAVLVEDQTDPGRVLAVGVAQRRRGVQLVFGALEEDGAVRQRQRHPTDGGIRKILLVVGGLDGDAGASRRFRIQVREGGRRIHRLEGLERSPAPRILLPPLRQGVVRRAVVRERLPRSSRWGALEGG